MDGVKSTTSAMFGEAKDVFLATLPIGTGILTNWFADRSATKGRDDARATATLTAGAPATAAEMD